MDTVEIAPRWVAAGKAEAVVHLPASDAYVAYHFKHKKLEASLELTATGNALQRRYRVLLPEGYEKAEVSKGGKAYPCKMERIEAARYAVFDSAGGGVESFRLRLIR